MLTCTLIAASSLSWMARFALAWDAWGVVVELASLAEWSGMRSRTRISFMCGTADVATARRVGSVGQTAIEEGEKAIQAWDWAARF